MTRTALHLGLAAALLVAGAACGGDDDTSAGAPSTTVAPTTTTTTDDTTATTDVVTTTTVPAPTTTVAPRPPATTDPPDTRGWGTSARDDPTMSPEDLYQVRVGRHGSYDRIVFDVNGIVEGPDVVGYHVAYVDGEVLADASGEPVPTRGPAALEIVVRAPWLGTGGSGHQPWRQPPTVGDDLVPAAQLRGWATMREVAFAGSFEGQTTIAVGVSAELPFQVGAFERDGYSHVYVDIAHPR
jgi:hypothetical protein